MWKQFRDTLYEVSTEGEVKSNYTNRILKTRIDRYGYELVSLSINKKMKTFKVHRLVAECFIKNPESKPVVNHIDHCRSNNKVENLEWSTIKENIDHSIKNGGNIDLNKLWSGRDKYLKSEKAIEHARSMGLKYKRRNLKQYTTENS